MGLKIGFMSILDKLAICEWTEPCRGDATLQQVQEKGLHLAVQPFEHWL
jgi:hypothetical protein